MNFFAKPSPHKGYRAKMSDTTNIVLLLHVNKTKIKPNLPEGRDGKPRVSNR